MIVEGHCLDDAKGSQRKKNAVAFADLSEVNALFPVWQTQSPTTLQNRLACYAGKDACGQRWRANRAFLDPKHVASRAFRDFLGGVQQKAFIHAAIMRFHRRHDLQQAAACLVVGERIVRSQPFCTFGRQAMPTTGPTLLKSVL